MSNPDPRRLAYWLSKDVNKAIRDFTMIEDGDRVAVAVSGGKDSLSLLRLLDWRRTSVPESYELAVVHVVGDTRGSQIPVCQPLIDWLEAEGYPFLVEPLYLSEEESLPLNCQRCTWNRRRTLFEAAHRLGCNVVALGHHADDLAETTVLNLFVGGRVETMAPAANYFDGLLRLIRPLCKVPETELRRFARACDFPPPPPECSRSDQSRRQVAKDILRQAKKLSPDARGNLLRAGLKYRD
ncbi:MAG: ATP-binding protein [Chloroflexota bacterium]|nr:ATP-binding protein [Chloroflexota bacterium]